MKNNSVQKVVATGIGAALFFVLARFVAVPSGIPNTNITFQYAAQAVFAVIYGPVVGCLSGFIGHVLTDMSWGGVWWTWAFATAVYGLIVGLFAKKINIRDGNFSKNEIITYVLANLVANVVAWGIIAPVGDIVIYKEDANLVFTQGLIAGAGDFLFAVVIGGLLLYGYSKTIAKSGSLDKE
ncbi:MAG: ECF-type riboflavin transporter substrate-binding protein [Erysipelotrichaceae bacterium]|jgi:energy-coupling factor transport system substrate-specific component|nr:ECF-type riboflavin transporter substrate-binding protein [Erysipelotrichaceae bacterium]